MYLSIEPNYNVIVNTVPPKQKNAHNRRDLWDSGSTGFSWRPGLIGYL